MAHILEQLLTDHRNIDKVLTVLEHEIDRYDQPGNADEEGPDLSLVFDILDYIHAYPDKFHHPLEEAAFDCMRERGLGDPEEIAAIRREHGQLSKTSSEIRVLFNSIKLGSPVSLKDLHTKLNEFLQQQRDHISREEQTVFQSMKQLDDKASDEARARVKPAKDPVFSKFQEEQYNTLLERLDE